MRSAILCILIPLVLALVSCGQRKRDAFFYEQMVDSIRKAEQLKEMKAEKTPLDKEAIELTENYVKYLRKLNAEMKTI